MILKWILLYINNLSKVPEDISTTRVRYLNRHIQDRTSCKYLE